jgi:hypothetical protein
MNTKELLTAMQSGSRPRGTSIRWQFKWDLDGEPCGRAVSTLIKQGLAEPSYYSGGSASLDLTDKGRAA